MKMHWTDQRNCPVCGFPIALKGKTWICTEPTCGHMEQRETAFEIAIRIGKYDRYFGILKVTAEE